ncbi:hypothetical protein Q3O60_11760 [Alkalimonas collagenimarina]|uniref:Uncharacterized protein n=1 Tax=Alkalimonas collagenimarina TaxID=400390 RepID=A0ABT9H0L8_9GAMM|nr:hypothetical protein [Alkalimonas collagenimarina]MDP4536869.1 hypothetical protein [Alkalimonas collagenimarina]
MLPGKLYEFLPYLYAIAGAMTVFIMPGHPVLTSFSGAVLIVTAGLVWVLRSEHRRMDTGIRGRSAGPLPFWCYELLPFTYILAALLLFVWASTPLLYPSAVIFLIIGHQLWFLRSSQRKHRKGNYAQTQVHG